LYVQRVFCRDSGVLMFVYVDSDLNLFGKQIRTFARKSLWICLPPYFSVRDQFPDFFLPVNGSRICKNAGL
jgi:hypothetical protein